MKKPSLSLVVLGSPAFHGLAMPTSRTQELTPELFQDSGQLLGGNSASTDVALGDVDGDDDLDAVVAIARAANQLWLNDGDGQFTETDQEFFPRLSVTTAVALGNFDNDEDLDVFFMALPQ